MRLRKVKFRVEGLHMDGKNWGTLTVEPKRGVSGVQLVTYRPAYGREYTLPITEVCEMICWRAAKKEGGE